MQKFNLDLHGDLFKGQMIFENRRAMVLFAVLLFLSFILVKLQLLIEVLSQKSFTICTVLCSCVQFVSMFFYEIQMFCFSAFLVGYGVKAKLKLIAVT